MPWINKRNRAHELKLQELAVESARIEERIATLKMIRWFMLAPGPESELILASKATVGLLADKLMEYWGLRDTAEVFRKWGVE